MHNMVKSCVVGFTAAVALCAATVAGAWPTGLSAPGIGTPGNPNFRTGGVSAFLVGSSASGYTFTMVGVDPTTATFTNGKAMYSVDNEIFELTAHFDANGHLLTGMSNTLQIFGSVPTWRHASAGSPIVNLFSANLTDVGVDATHDALGFATADFSGWANQFAVPGATESAWLFALTSGDDHGSKSSGSQSWKNFLAELENHSPLQNAIFRNLGSITTVPLPASALLLLAGLAGLGGSVRLRQRPGIPA